MAFRTNAAPYQRAKRSTLQIMIELTIALLLVWVAAVVYTFIEAPDFGVKSILMMVVAVATTAACDVVNTLIRHKKGSKDSIGKEIVHDLIHNYSWVTAIIFTLTLPVWASYYVVIIGSVFATVVVKLLFGGFGKNIFNPAIMGRIFVGLCFSGQLSANAVKFKHESIDAVTGATVTTQFNNATSWLSDLPLENLSMKDLFLGNYFGSLGETFTILILVLGIILAIRKVINWRTPVFYLGTVALTSLVIALVCGFSNPLSYVGYQIAFGGLAFGAIFMLTDPVTGPTSPFGKSLMAVIAGLLTVLIRVKGGYPEGVMFSIAVCNLISPAVDYLTTGKSNAKLGVKYATVFGSLAVAILLCTSVAWNVNGGKEVYAINGIPFDQYNQMTEEYGFTLKDGHKLSLNDKTGKEAFAVVDDKNAKVASVYLIELKNNIEIPDAHGAKLNMSVYIGISSSDQTLYDIAFVKGATGATWANKADTWANSNATGKDMATILGTSSADSGATYSVEELKVAIKEAYGLFNADNLLAYGFTLKDGHKISANVSGNETLTIVDANDAKVASVYLISSDKVVDPEAHGATFKMSAYVAINVADSTVYDTAFVVGGTGKRYGETADTWANDNVNGKDVAAIESADATCGATYSAKELKEAVKSALALFAADNA